MNVTETPIAESLTLTLSQEIQVRASLADHLRCSAGTDGAGKENESSQGKNGPMKLEAWPGGRWFRDLGDNKRTTSGGNVQAIKSPTLLEITGHTLYVIPGRLESTSTG